MTFLIRGAKKVGFAPANAILLGNQKSYPRKGMPPGPLRERAKAEFHYISHHVCERSNPPFFFDPSSLAKREENEMDRRWPIVLERFERTIKRIFYPTMPIDEVCRLDQFSPHLARSTLRYLKGYLGKGMIYTNHGHGRVEIYSNADWGRSIEESYCGPTWRESS
ncbi:hypothetical protein HAX54_013329 [Datura stramonium]|uniref:Uncharacterized protein n=1 Tax=Datura stramonium TaxID=4076 RepID=A0ABS8RJ68_DATST|nr:hypothetical protein [Datura stramonium]